MRARKLLYILEISLVVVFATILMANFFPLHEKIYHNVTGPAPVSDPQFARSLSSLLGPHFSDGNKIQSFQNGVEIFPAMLEAIHSAQHTITMEAYIYWSDKIGQQFVDALIKRAQAGVKVHLLVDWMGSKKLERKDSDRLEKAGVEFEYFRPLQFSNITHMNNRTHRRILVIDGKVGFTGGVGFCDEWAGNADDSTKWRDTQYRIEGPVVADLQNAFMDTWLKLRPDVHHDWHYFPELKPVGKSYAQVFRSSPEAGSENVRIMYQMAIAAAQNYIKIESAYFLPDKAARRELVEARKRGVDIEIILPGPYGDAPMVKHASRADWGDLLKAGIKIFEYQPSRFHRKVMIVDGEFVSVGATNFDNRSFRLNHEDNLNVLDKEVAQHELEQFIKDRSNSNEVSLNQWENRPWSLRAKETLSSLIEDQL